MLKRLLINVQHGPAFENHVVKCHLLKCSFIKTVLKSFDNLDVKKFDGHRNLGSVIGPDGSH